MLVATSTGRQQQAPNKKKTKPRKKTTVVDHNAVISSVLLAAEKVRSPNFAPWEDLLLSKAWVSVSMDPSVGCNQKKESFWKRVEEKFNLLYDAYEPTEDEGVKAVGGRTAAQIDNRFTKNIRTDIVLFNKYFAQIHIEKPSGVPFKHHVYLAMDRFMSIENRVFKFESCVPVLHQVPKYNPILGAGGGSSLGGDSDEENEEEGVNRIRGVMGNNLVRPPGRKVTKAAEALARRRKATNMKQDVETMAVPAAKDIIAHSFSSVAASMHSRSVFDKKREMVKMYKENGMAEEAKAMMAEMAALIRAEQELIAKAGPPPTGALSAMMMHQMHHQIFPGSTPVAPTTPVLMTPRRPQDCSFPVPATRATPSVAVAPLPSAMETEEDDEEEEEEKFYEEEEKESQWLLAGREHLRVPRRSSVSLPRASRLPPDEEEDKEGDDDVTVVPTQHVPTQHGRVVQQGRVTPSPQTVMNNHAPAPGGAGEEQAECEEATQWGSQDTSFSAALSAIGGGPTATPSGYDGDGLLYDGPDSNPILYGPDSQDDHPSSTRFKRNYRRGGVYRAY